VLQGVQQVFHPGGSDRQRPAARGFQAQAELQLPGRDPLLRRGFSASSSASSCADPRCSISRDPRREDYTTCTAVAPDVVLTVRRYGTRPLYEPRLVRKLSSHELQTHRSAPRTPHEPAIVSQLRCQQVPDDRIKVPLDAFGGVGDWKTPARKRPRAVELADSHPLQQAHGRVDTSERTRNTGKAT
jgi:hypothetical protein